jgi:glycosidase
MRFPVNSFRKVKYLLLAALFNSIFSQHVAHAQSSANVNDIYFQAFGWDIQNQTSVSSEGGLYNYMLNRADGFASAGFNVIWLPPASKSTGGMGYIPTELYDFSQTSFGTEAQLRALLTKFNNSNPRIHPMADIVLNHRGGTTSWTDFTNPNWGCETICFDDDGGNTQVANFQGCRPTGANDTGDDFSGARDLDHTNTTVRNGSKEFLQRLKALGFDSWRWDVAKGFSASYFGEYITASNPYASVGEYWDGNMDALKGWINGTGGKSAIFDFNMYYNILQPAFNSGNYGVLGQNSGFTGLAGQFGFADKAITFIDNHDTFVKPGSFVSNDNIMKGYAYLLTHHGIPCVFFPHYFGGTFRKDGVTVTYTSNEIAIKKLMAVRRANGINAYSQISVQNSSGFYAAIIDGKVAVKIGPGNWSPAGSGWILNTFGNDYAVWSKTEINTAPTLSISPNGGTYVQGNTVQVSLNALDDKAGTTIFYTLNGSEPNESSLVYAGSLNISTNTTLKAFVKDAEGLKSATITAGYNFLPLQDITIRFRPPSNWGNAPFYLHYWNVLTTGSFPSSQWPGKEMSGPDLEGFYSFTFNNIARTNLLFTKSSSGPQTVDVLNVTQSNCYETTGTAVKLDAVVVDCLPLGLNNDNLLSEVINLYPNPTGDQFRLSKDIRSLVIRNLTGAVVYNEASFLPAGQSIDVSNLDPGIYLIEALSEAKVRSNLRLIKQ